MAAARAEARRKAILARGNDRLAKLTTSARGDDAPTFVRDETPPRGAAANLSSFVGEDSPMPPPKPPAPATEPRISPAPAPFAFENSPSSTASGMPAPDPSVWSEEQQRQFFHALMGAGLGGQQAPSTGTPPQIAGSGFSSGGSRAGSLPPQQDVPGDPLAAMMAQLAQMDPSAAGKMQQQSPFMQPPMQMQPQKEPTLLQKMLPLLHVFSAWLLLAYFALWREPRAFAESAGDVVDSTVWKRWADLAWKAPGEGWGVQFVPFLWAFVTIQIILHSTRIMLGTNRFQPPMLLSLAMAYLPPPFPSLITNGLRYISLGGAFLDDLASVVFGLGVIILVSGWFAT
ncbi:hypothetical protein CONPUDRAFT_148337 [Coniophora puteana RWD-64-598 SS2]|uniref:GET complex subunit GET2 n=1 Tax=Coniophora puteana (strain RWD-64-598) TaxID=741705 RepID=A0A5M3N5A7_CONPW|nr:uncharacterized protein CONPUDRAFT_148337 [Coniophora puteana RWD-64-598 SS2]EIW86244.1 hypothetical protein CONPUDRAFT_148337 [Coniophora puteana RWD-64-598 SS2]